MFVGIIGAEFPGRKLLIHFIDSSWKRRLLLEVILLTSSGKNLLSIFVICL